MTETLYAFADPSVGIIRLRDEVSLLERELNRCRRRRKYPASEEEIALAQEIMCGIISRGMCINLMRRGLDPIQWFKEHLESTGIYWEGRHTALMFNIAPNAGKYEEAKRWLERA